MKSILFSVLSVSFFVALKGVAGQGRPLTVDTPSNVVECEPVQLTFSGGTPPYFCSLTPGENPNGAAVVNFSPRITSPIIWTANVPANTWLVFECRDSSGFLGQSAPFTVQASSSDGCQKGSGSSVGATASLAARSSAAATPAITPAATSGS